MLQKEASIPRRGREDWSKRDGGGVMFGPVKRSTTLEPAIRQNIPQKKETSPGRGREDSSI